MNRFSARALWAVACLAGLTHGPGLAQNAPADPLPLGVTLSIAPLPETGPEAYHLPPSAGVVQALDTGDVAALLAHPALRDVSVVILDLAPPKAEPDGPRCPLVLGLDEPAQRINKAIQVVRAAAQADIILDGYDLPKDLTSDITSQAIRGAAGVVDLQRVRGFAGRLPALPRLEAGSATQVAQALSQLQIRLRERLDEISAACQAAGDVVFFLRTADPILLAGLMPSFPERVVPLVEASIPRPPAANYALHLAALAGAPRELHLAAPTADEILRSVLIAAAHRPAWVSLGDARLLTSPSVDAQRLSEGLAALRSFLSQTGGFQGQAGAAILVDAATVAADTLFRRLPPAEERHRANFVALALNDAGCPWSVVTSLDQLDELQAQAVVVSGGARLDAKLIAELEKWVERGGSLIAYGDIGSQNVVGEPLLPSARDAVDALLPADREREFRAEVKTIRFGVDIPGSQRRNGAQVSCLPTANAVWRATSRPRSVEIARWLELNAPAIVEGDRGRGKVLWINAPPHVFQENIVRDVAAYLHLGLSPKPEEERRPTRTPPKNVIPNPEVWPAPAWTHPGTIYDIHLGGDPLVGVALGPRPEATSRPLVLFLSQDLRIRPTAGCLALATRDGTRCLVSAGTEVQLGGDKPLECPGRGTWIYAPRGGDLVARGPWLFAVGQGKRGILLTDAGAEVLEAYQLQDKACQVRLAATGPVKMRIPREALNDVRVEVAEWTPAPVEDQAGRWVPIDEWVLRAESLEFTPAHSRRYQVSFPPRDPEPASIELKPDSFVGGRRGTVDGRDVVWLERYLVEGVTAQFERWEIPQRDATLAIEAVVGDLYGRQDILPGPLEVGLRVLVNGREIYRQTPPLKTLRNDGDTAEWTTLRIPVSPDVFVRGRNRLTLVSEGPNWIAFHRVALRFGE